MVSVSSLLSIFVLVFRLLSFSTEKASSDRTHKAFVRKLTRELKLHPKNDVKIRNTNAKHKTSTWCPRHVEKQLSLPGSPAPNLGHDAGYILLPNTVDARMFYLFFESRGSKADPVVIWLTGGQGCSSEVSLFYENGPFKITKNMSLVWNDYGWDKVSNIIFVDQPTGTGFSYSSSEEDLRHDEKGVSNDLYNFLQEFFKNKEGNKNKEGIPVNLKGFGIGNGLNEPGIQYPAYPDFALNMSIITQSEYDEIIQMIPDCTTAVNQCGTDGEQTCTVAFYTCQLIFQSILNISGNINYYDIRKQCQGPRCYDFSDVETYLNLPKVKKALGVGDIEFQLCSSKVHRAMLVDRMRNLETVIPPLLEDDINLLIYVGEYDLICNWLGNLKWVNAMPWSGQKAFNVAPTGPFLVDGIEAGTIKSNGVLTFLKVHNAGHMVPMDQPKNSLQMLQKWTQGNLSC